MADDNHAQSLAVSEITAAIGTMDQSTQQNAAMVEQTSAAARSLSAETRNLVQKASVFQFERRERNIPVAIDRRAGGRGSAVDRQPQAAAPIPAIPHRVAAQTPVASKQTDPEWSSF